MAHTFVDYNHVLQDLGQRYDMRLQVAPALDADATASHQTFRLLEAFETGNDAPSHHYIYNAYPGLTRKIDMMCAGGKPPYHYYIVDAPTGATIGEKYGDSEYGILSYVIPTESTVDMTVRIVDQDLNILTARWSVVCSKAHFGFIAGSGANGPAGNDSSPDPTILAPYLTLDGAFLDADATSVHANKEFILRGAATEIVYDAPPDYQMRLAQATPVTKPATISGNFDDAVKPSIDFDTHKPTNPSGHGAAIVNVLCKNSPGDNSGVKDSRFVQVNGQWHHGYLFNVGMHDMVAGDSVLYPVPTGTAFGGQTDATGYATTTTVITLSATGTGSFDVGDTVVVDGDSNYYTIASGDADISNGGSITLTTGLLEAIPASATSITIYKGLGNDNPAGVFFSANGTGRRGWSMSHCDMDNSTNSMYSLFTMEGFMSRFNTIANGTIIGRGAQHNGNHGFIWKMSCQDCFSLYDECWDNVDSISDSNFDLSGLEAGVGADYYVDGNEVMHAKLKDSTDSNAALKLFTDGPTYAGGENLRNNYITRCTIYGKISLGTRAVNLTSTDNLEITDGSYLPAVDGATYTATKVGATEYSIAASPVDSNMDLAPAHEHYGKKGAGSNIT